MSKRSWVPAVPLSYQRLGQLGIMAKENRSNHLRAGNACNRVLKSSMGLITVALIVLAILPATKGTGDR
jgi:hypothetical protein